MDEIKKQFETSDEKLEGETLDRVSGGVSPEGWKARKGSEMVCCPFCGKYFTQRSYEIHERTCRPSSR